MLEERECGELCLSVGSIFAEGRMDKFICIKLIQKKIWVPVNICAFQS